MELDDFRNSLIRTVEREALVFLKDGKLGGEYSEAIDRFVENEGILRITAMILRGDDAKAIRVSLDEEMFSERFCEREIERLESIERENAADAKRLDSEA